MQNAKQKKNCTANASYRKDMIKYKKKLTHHIVKRKNVFFGDMCLLRVAS